MIKKILAVTAALALTVTGLSLTTPAPAAHADTLIQQNNLQQVKDVFNGINAYRASKGLPAIRIATSINYTSQDWSETQATNGKISHRPNFGTYYPKGAMSYGEIVASRGGDSGQGLVDQWINSAPHEALLRGNFNVMGVGVAWSSNSSYERMYGTVNFARYNSMSSLTTYASVDEWVKATGQDTRQNADGQVASVKALPGGYVEAKGYAFDYSRRAGVSNVKVTNTTTGTSVQMKAGEAGYDLNPWDIPGPHGFTAKLEAKPNANNQVCITALNTFVGGTNKDLGCTTVFVEPLPSVPGMTVSRVSGADRYQTAATISKMTHAAGSVDTVYLVTGERFPDALSVAPAAAQPGKALLLTPGGHMTEPVKTELRRLNPKNVILIGDTSALANTIADIVKQNLPNVQISRIAGADRYETSVLIAKHAFPQAREAFVVSGENFPDALSAAPTAALAGAPVILVPRAGLTDVTKVWLQLPSLTAVKVAGGTPSVSANAFNQIGVASGEPVSRYAGVDRYETNRMLAKAGISTEQRAVFLASGENFPDALAAASAAPKMGPLLLTPSSCIPQQTFDMIANTYSPDRLYVLGSEATLSKSVSNLGTC